MNEKIIPPTSAGQAQSAAILPTAERYLTLRDVAQRLRCSRSTVWRLIKEHGLRVLRCGGITRVRERDLAAWEEKHMGGDGDVASKTN